MNILRPSRRRFLFGVCTPPQPLTVSEPPVPTASNCSHIALCCSGAASILLSTPVQVQLHTPAAFRWYRKHRNPGGSAREDKRKIVMTCESCGCLAYSVSWCRLWRGRSERKAHLQLVGKVIYVISLLTCMFLFLHSVYLITCHSD